MIVRQGIPAGKVTLLVGGGSGHEPLFAGFIGPNLADGAVAGNIFAAPPPDQILLATHALERGKGVLYLYGNYAGDALNFDMGAELAEAEGIHTKTVRVWDDVASAPPERFEDRRGIAGDFMVIKVAGGATGDPGHVGRGLPGSLQGARRMRSIGVAASAGTFPETGQPTFELPDDEIEIGMGLHGEPGVSRSKMMPADALVDFMLEQSTRPALHSRRRGVPAGQQPGRHHDDRAVDPQPAHPPGADAGRAESARHGDRQFLHQPGNGRFFDHADEAGRRIEKILRPAGLLPGLHESEQTMKTSLTLTETREMLRQVARGMISSQAILTEADRATGDGDHGVAMGRGFEAVLAALDDQEAADLKDLFFMSGTALITAAGGAWGSSSDRGFRWAAWRWPASRNSTPRLWRSWCWTV